MPFIEFALVVPVVQLAILVFNAHQKLLEDQTLAVKKVDPLPEPQEHHQTLVSKRIIPLYAPLPTILEE